jgi:putative transposase
MRESAKRKIVRQAQVAEAIQLTLDPEELRGTLMDLVVTAGLQTVQRVLERERDERCGPRYRHDAKRRATRAGYAQGELPLAGRRVAVARPRVVTKVDGKRREVPLDSWAHLASKDVLDRRAVDQVLVGVATRKYKRSLEALPPNVRARGASKSAVSRRFVAATSTAFSRLMARNLAELHIVALMIDGLVVGEHTVLVALGFDDKGDKHVLGLREGATENSAACKALLANLEERGLRTDRSLLAVLDGSKALASAVRAVFGPRALIQRCQVHKRRNVRDHLPEDLRDVVARRIRLAFQATKAETVESGILRLAAELEQKHPSAAESLREGLAETLTVKRLGLSGALERSLSSTNALENINGLIRHRTRNVRRWRDGKMVQRWTATALDDASKSFRRIRGVRDLPRLVAALRAHDAKLDAAERGDVDTAKKAA